MYTLLETEVCIEAGTLRYVQNQILGTFESEDIAIKQLQSEVDRTLDRGYFNVVVSRSETYSRLSNGGSYTKCYEIFVKLD